MTGLHHPDLAGLAEAARDASANLHVHVLAHEWRAFFATHASPAHFKVPEGVRSISIEEGLFCSGFAVYRDATLRDMHLDVGYGWQAAYMSPNEGGSGASTPLFVDMYVKVPSGAALANGDGVVCDHGDVKDRVGKVVAVMGQVASVLLEGKEEGEQVACPSLGSVPRVERCSPDLASAR